MTIRMVYIGRATAEGKKTLFHWWRMIDEETGELHTACRGYRHNLRPAKIGAVYRFHQYETGNLDISYGDNAPMFLNRWTNEEDIVKWELDDKTHETIKADRRSHDEEMNPTALYLCLKPILYAMKETNHIGRRLIKLIVLEILDRGIV